MFALKLLSFTLKALAAISVYLYKIDILGIRAEKSSTYDSSISTFIVACCVACLFAKIDLSKHFQSMSVAMVYGLESLLTVYGTETAMYLVWIPLLKKLSLLSARISKTFQKTTNPPAGINHANCMDSDIFCYLNIGLALFIASNTLKSFDFMNKLKSILPKNRKFIADSQPTDGPTKIINGAINLSTEANNAAMIEDSTKTKNSAIKVNRREKPKRKPILLLNVRL